MLCACVVCVRVDVWFVCLYGTVVVLVCACVLVYVCGCVCNLVCGSVFCRCLCVGV